MKISENKYQEILKQLNIQFSREGLSECRIENKSLIEISTRRKIIEVTKEDKYFHGALLNCDNYNFEVWDNELIIGLGFCIE